MTKLKDAILAIKATVPITTLLNDEGIRVSTDMETQIRCFAHDDVRPSARVYPQTSTVFCWTCGHLFDVVSAYKVIKSVTLNAAVKELIERYKVDVAKQPHAIDNFFKQASEYHQGDPRKIGQIVQDYGVAFQKHYQAMRGHKFLFNVIDAIWADYDDLYCAMIKPKEMLRRAKEWYESAIVLIDSYKETADALQTVHERAQAAGLK